MHPDWGELLAYTAITVVAALAFWRAGRNLSRILRIRGETPNQGVLFLISRLTIMLGMGILLGKHGPLRLAEPDDAKRLSNSERRREYDGFGWIMVLMIFALMAALAGNNWSLSALTANTSTWLTRTWSGL